MHWLEGVNRVNLKRELKIILLTTKKISILALILNFEYNIIY